MSKHPIDCVVQIMVSLFMQKLNNILIIRSKLFVYVTLFIIVFLGFVLCKMTYGYCSLHIVCREVGCRQYIQIKQ